MRRAYWMEYLLRRARYDYFTELIGFQFWQVISTIELLTCSSYRHVFAQQRAVSQLITGFPSRVLKKYFMVYLRFRRDKNEGWGRRFLCNSGSSGARQRDRSCRQALEVGPIRQTSLPSLDENAGRRHLRLYARYNHSSRLTAHAPDPVHRLRAQAQSGR